MAPVLQQQQQQQPHAHNIRIALTKFFSEQGRQPFNSVRNNNRTGTNPIKCPYFDELDAVLGCRPMNNPGDMRMDNGGSSDEESDCVRSSDSTEDHNTSRQNDAEEACSHGSASNATPPHHPPAEPKPQARRSRKGRKTQIMEAMDKGLDRLLQYENAHERERFEWEKEMERNRMELERKRLDFEMKKMEAEEKRAEENRALMLQMFQCFRPQSHNSPYLGPHYYPYPTPSQRPSAESMEFPSTAPGPPAPAAYQMHYFNDAGCIFLQSLY
ncbi:uncharacterized protein [Misgurnus anguillicaudatus]|uniref:uncharacterized protein n=1 Tax=Misgurnus anguillicaudatus TaxID=75329 RepID=UPI003CCF50C1